MSNIQTEIFMDNLREMRAMWLEDYNLKESDVKIDQWGNCYIELPEEVSHRNSDGNYETDDIKYHILYLPEKYNFKV